MNVILSANATLLSGMLEIAVRMEMDRLFRWGGPSDVALDWARSIADQVAEKGDTLQCGGKKGEAAALFSNLAKAMAIMSFCPGGVMFAGTKYESLPALAESSPSG